MIPKIYEFDRLLFRKFLFILIGTVLFFCDARQGILAKQEMLPVQTEESKSYEIEFVIDVSGSMLQSDVGVTAMELLTETIELLEDTNTKVGIVGYNHTIAYQYSFIPLSNTTEKEKLIHSIYSIQFHGDTDIGLGLKTAVQEFSDADGKVEKILILLSDGETDLPISQSDRTIEDSLQDEQEAIAIAKEKGVVIYTIGLATRFEGNVDELGAFSRQTGGTSYAVSSIHQLYTAINSILQKHYLCQSYIVEKEEIDGESKFILLIPDSHLSKVAIWIFPAVDQDKFQILTTSEQIRIHQKSCGTRIELRQPPKETITIKFDDIFDSGCSMMVEGIYNLTEVFDVPLQTEKRHDTELICSFIDNETGEMILDSTFYQSFSATMIVVDKEKKERKIYPAEATENGFHTIITSEQSGIFQISVQYQGDFLIGTTEEKEIQFINAHPKQIIQIEETIPNRFQKSIIELEKIFEDRDGDRLTYYLEQEYDGLLCSLEGTRLTIQTRQDGDFSIPIQAVDEEGEIEIGEIRIHSIPFWQYYHSRITVILTVTILLLGILISFLIWKHYKKKLEPSSKQKKPEEFLEGVLVGYFIRVENEEEIAPLRWNLNELHRKSITLKELLEKKEVSVKIAESSKIRIKAEENRTLSIRHDTDCVILHGSKEVPKKQEEKLYMGEKIYIGFENQKTELELRYKSQ